MRLHGRALALLRGGQTVSAIAAWRAFIDRYPGDPRLPEAYYWRGMAFSLLHDLPRAQQHFLEVLKRFPRSPQAAAAKAMMSKHSSKKMHVPAS